MGACAVYRNFPGFQYVQLKSDPRGSSWAFVTFNTPEEAQAAAVATNGQLLDPEKHFVLHVELAHNNSHIHPTFFHFSPRGRFVPRDSAAASVSSANSASSETPRNRFGILSERWDSSLFVSHHFLILSVLASVQKTRRFGWQVFCPLLLRNQFVPFFALKVASHDCDSMRRQGILLWLSCSLLICGMHKKQQQLCLVVSLRISQRSRCAFNLPEHRWERRDMFSWTMTALPHHHPLPFPLLHLTRWLLPLLLVRLFGSATIAGAEMPMMEQNQLWEIHFFEPSLHECWGRLLEEEESREKLQPRHFLALPQPLLFLFLHLRLAQVPPWLRSLACLDFPVLATSAMASPLTRFQQQ